MKNLKELVDEIEDDIFLSKDVLTRSIRIALPDDQVVLDIFEFETSTVGSKIVFTPSKYKIHGNFEDYTTTIEEEPKKIVEVVEENKPITQEQIVKELNKHTENGKTKEDRI